MRKEYTREECYEIALTCTHAWEMQKKNGSAYNSATRNGWIKDYTWFERPKHCKWNYETCYAVAKLCTSTVEMRRKFSTAYRKAAKNNWIADYTWFEKKKNIYTDNLYLIYSYYFEEYNSIYIGLTCDINQRDRNHRGSGIKKSAVYKFSIEHNCDIPEPTIIELGLNADNARVAEDLWVRYYNGLGYNVLNKAKTGAKSGSLGACAKKWTRNTCCEAARQCNSRSEFKRLFAGAYNIPKRNGWLCDYYWFTTTHELLTNTSVKWTYEACYSEAKHYKTRNSFQKNSGGAYKAALKHGWIDDYTWFAAKRKAA